MGELLYQICQYVIILCKRVCVPVDVLQKPTVSHQLEQGEFALDKWDEVLSDVG